LPVWGMLLVSTVFLLVNLVTIFFSSYICVLIHMQQDE
jgi:uncharacterized membrane protein